MSKTKNKIRISFIGGNAEDVTGSMTLIEFGERKILIEAGLFQSENLLKNYQINNRRLPFKPSEIDLIFIGHAHIDHIGILARLYAQGCHAKIIVPNGIPDLFELMAEDSAFIFEKDIQTIKKRYGKDVFPIYTESDISATLPYFQEYGYNKKIELDDDISFRLIPSGHIICASQIELWINCNNHTSKIAYTSDLGNISIPKHYVTPFEPIDKCNILIGESTYADKSRSMTMKDREKDLEKIYSVIDTVCCDNKSKVLIPVFALDRVQNILTILYDMFHDNKDFHIPIIVDSPLAIKITKLYERLLDGEELDKYHDVMNWNNIKFIEEYADSKVYQESKDSVIVLACSGFMSAGRSRQWAKVLLPDVKAHILFVGYSSEGSLSYKIKKGKVTKTISIDGKPFPNRCNCSDLHSFSSHLTHDGLLKYYSDINADKICLVHGDFKPKCEFAKELQNEISKKNKCGRVIAVNKSTELLL